jgi:recombination protein RecA
MADKDFLKGLIKSVEDISKDGGGRTALGTDLTLTSHVAFGIPTRIPVMDLAIGRPGYPAGRMVELFGLSATGKTTAAYHALAQVQRMSGTAVLIDTERTFDPHRAAECGIDPSTLLVAEANDIEEVFEKINAMLTYHEESKSDRPLLLAVDSITAVESRESASVKLDDSRRLGDDARSIRRGLRKINQRVAETKATVLFINHAIANVGGYKATVSAGGNALKLFASLRVEFQFVGNITEGKDDAKTRLGQTVSINTEKNKVKDIGIPKFKADLTQHGFDLHDGLFSGFERIGSIKRVNNLNWFFAPTQTTFTRKEWRSIVDGWQSEDGKALGVEGFYEFFMRLATEGGYIRPYGGSND